MKNPIKLCNADLTKDIFKDVMFFSIAGSGAMGEPGGVIFYAKSGELYSFNYVYGDVDIKKVEKCFPILAKCKFGMNSAVPTGWNYVYIGMGNHLIVNDDVIEAFDEKIGVDADPSEVFMNWRRYAEEILSEEG